MWGPEAWLLLLLLASSTGRLAWAAGTLAAEPTLAHTHTPTHTHTLTLFPLTLDPLHPSHQKSQSSSSALCPLLAPGQVTMSGVPECLCQSLA